MKRRGKSLVWVRSVATSTAAAILLALGPGLPASASGAGPGKSDSGAAESGEARQGKRAVQSSPRFEFTRGFASVNNPYCDIVTYVVRELPSGASSSQDRSGRPVIMIDAGTLKADPDYAQFLIAHECCHHSLGHIKARAQNPSRLGPQPFYYLQAKLKGIELEADRCAVLRLKATGARDAIERARAYMLTYGYEPTGAHYPTGIERADNIARAAAAEDETRSGAIPSP